MSWELIENFIPDCEQELKDKLLMLTYIDTFKDNILTRNNLFAHMTCSSMIYNKSMDKVLMIYHNIYQSWSWTGGHADGDSDFLRVALKEAREETGIVTLSPITPNIISLDVLPVWGHKKNGSYVSSHLHLNVTYSFIANELDTVTIKQDENSDVAWIPISRLESYVTEPDMIPVYQKIIAKNTLK